MDPISGRASAEQHDETSHGNGDVISPIEEERQSCLEPQASHAGNSEDSRVTTRESHLLQNHPLIPKASHKQDEDAAALRYRKRSLVLLGIYLPIVIVPWVLQCVLAVRPLNEPSYYNQQGKYGALTYIASLSWPVLVRLLNVIGALLTVPIVGALLSQAAVIYTQRRHIGQKLNMRQTLALADRTWSDVLGVWAAMRGNGTSSRILISNEVIWIMTCNDNPVFDFGKYCNPGRLPVIVANDPEPAFLANMRQNSIVRETMDSLATTFDIDQQPHLWRDPQSASAGVTQDNGQSTSTFFYWFDGVAGANENFFISNVQNNTQTGILREHAMRLNSTTQCSRITRDQFPATCAGAMPLVKSLNDPNVVTLRICAPGDYGTSPWTISRDRQDIVEELYVDAFIPWDSNATYYSTSYGVGNFTTRCVTNTTRGYFELPNYRNNYLAQPLEDQWPDNETMWTEWNDYILNEVWTVPLTNDSYSDTDLIDNPQGPDPFGTWSLYTPGPLMTVALALFGNASFFYSVNEAVMSHDLSIMNQTCQDANFPFQRIDFFSGTTFADSFNGGCTYVAEQSNNYSSIQDAGQIEMMLYNWLTLFNNTDLPTRGFNADSPSSNAAAALDIGVYLATQAWLTQTAAAAMPFDSRNIYTSPGAPAIRPKRSLAATIIISILLAVQVSGLVALIWYIYTVPTWTPHLNALAVAQMAQSIPDGHLPPLGPISESQMKKLEELDGLVGVAEDDWGKEGGVAVKAEHVKLARGATGVVRKRHAFRKVKVRSQMSGKNGRSARSHSMV